MIISNFCSSFFALINHCIWNSQAIFCRLKAKVRCLDLPKTVELPLRQSFHSPQGP